MSMEINLRWQILRLNEKMNFRQCWELIGAQNKKRVHKWAVNDGPKPVNKPADKQRNVILSHNPCWYCDNPTSDSCSGTHMKVLHYFPQISLWPTSPVAMGTAQRSQRSAPTPKHCQRSNVLMNTCAHECDTWLTEQSGCVDASLPQLLSIWRVHPGSSSNWTCYEAFSEY